MSSQPVTQIGHHLEKAHPRMTLRTRSSLPHNPYVQGRRRAEWSKNRVTAICTSLPPSTTYLGRSEAKQDVPGLAEEMTPIRRQGAREAATTCLKASIPENTKWPFPSRSRVIRTRIRRHRRRGRLPPHPDAAQEQVMDSIRRRNTYYEFAVGVPCDPEVF